MPLYSDDIANRLTARTKKAIQFCGDFRGKKILNIGCYDGWLEKIAVKRGAQEVTGIDVNKKFVALAQKNVPQAKFLQASVLKLPFVSQRFEMVTMFDVIEHLPKGTELKALKEVKRVLKKGGKLFLSTPKSNWLANLLDPAWYFGHRHYSVRKIKNLLKTTGFTIERLEIKGGFYELFSMIMFYAFKWLFHREIPFKDWFEKRRNEEYLNKNGFVTLFVKAS